MVGMTADTTTTPDPLRTGFGRVLIAVYGVFAISASARAGFQAATEFAHAPIAYTLSAVAAALYVVATIALATTRRWSVPLARVAVGCEGLGVILVGAWSFLAPQTFPEATVWSHFGSGYGYIPLVLPFVGAWWLWRHRDVTANHPERLRATS